MCNVDHYQTSTYLVGLDPGIALSYALFRRNYSDALPLGVILSDPRELTLCFILLLLHIPPATFFSNVLHYTDDDHVSTSHHTGLLPPPRAS